FFLLHEPILLHVPNLIVPFLDTLELENRNKWMNDMVIVLYLARSRGHFLICRRMVSLNSANKKLEVFSPHIINRRSNPWYIKSTWLSKDNWKRALELVMSMQSLQLPDSGTLCWRKTHERCSE
ncbi:hypothetical protein LINPERHAP1_LOCUS11989, partial [Linum perenne]